MTLINMIYMNYGGYKFFDNNILMPLELGLRKYTLCTKS